MKFEDALKEAREKGTALRLKGEEVYQNSHLIYKENDSIFYANGRPLYDNAECALYNCSRVPRRTSKKSKRN